MMACIYKRGKFYQVQYQENGTLVQRSLGVTTKDAAQKLLGDLIKNQDQGRAGLGKRPSSNDKAFVQFQTQVIDKKSPPWRKRLMQQFKWFRDWLAADGRNFANLKISDLEDYLATRRVVLADKTLNDELAMLKVFYEWALDREYVLVNPCAKIKRVRVSSKAVRVFSQEELHLVMKYATEYQRPYYQLLLYTGMRDGELRNLEWKDIDFSNRQIFVRIKKDWQPKTRQGRTIPMALEAYDLFNSLPNRGDHVFSTSNGKRWVAPRQPWVDLLLRIAKKEGVDLHGQVSIHTLRHTFATYCLMNGIDIKTVSEFLGHTSVKMTEKYLHLLPEHKAKEITKVDFTKLLAVGHAA